MTRIGQFSLPRLRAHVTLEMWTDLELADQNLALLDPPLLPLARLLVLLRSLGPVGRAETVEERARPGLTDGLGDLEREADPVLERATV